MLTQWVCGASSCVRGGAGPLVLPGVPPVVFFGSTCVCVSLRSVVPLLFGFFARSSAHVFLCA